MTYHGRLDYDDGTIDVVINGRHYPALYVDVDRQSKIVTVGGTGTPPPRVVDTIVVPFTDGQRIYHVNGQAEIEMFELPSTAVAEWDIAWWYE